MKMHRLDHVYVKASRLDQMFQVYEDILGLNSGPRPNFPFQGASIDPRIEHFVFRATGLAELIKTLTQAGIRHSVDPASDLPNVQVDLEERGGNYIHIDFHADELAGYRFGAQA